MRLSLLIHCLPRVMLTAITQPGLFIFDTFSVDHQIVKSFTPSPIRPFSLSFLINPLNYKNISIGWCSANSLYVVKLWYMKINYLLKCTHHITHCCPIFTRFYVPLPTLYGLHGIILNSRFFSIFGIMILVNCWCVYNLFCFYNLCL